VIELRFYVRVPLDTKSGHFGTFFQYRGLVP